MNSLIRIKMETDICSNETKPARSVNLCLSRESRSSNFILLNSLMPLVLRLYYGGLSILYVPQKCECKEIFLTERQTEKQYYPFCFCISMSLSGNCLINTPPSFCQGAQFLSEDTSIIFESFSWAYKLPFKLDYWNNTSLLDSPKQ